jgi:hypothetical protein
MASTGVAAAIGHAAHHAGQPFLEGVAQAFKGLQSTAAAPGYPVAKSCSAWTAQLAATASR